MTTPSPSRHAAVLVVGGGPVGLSMGLLLHRLGIPFAVLEKGTRLCKPGGRDRSVAVARSTSDRRVLSPESGPPFVVTRACRYIGGGIAASELARRKRLGAQIPCSGELANLHAIVESIRRYLRAFDDCLSIACELLVLSVIGEGCVRFQQTINELALLFLCARDRRVRQEKCCEK